MQGASGKVSPFIEGSRFSELRVKQTDTGSARQWPEMHTIEDGSSGTLSIGSLKAGAIREFFVILLFISNRLSRSSHFQPRDFSAACAV
ncbi:hypothetical protein FHW96_002528 [Novosphingobium sp. SG751A]|uniref:hypothetical protein n=1 Tax=Novosphingobium sp. SG751A TaxID=2587000 RepID=UPI001551C72B|nr:hypothetical protein [Novosphingobium sp. SG751A]NOW46368.1 hypothetical protein [Novosphingobium sp. SG751A]